MVIFHSPPFLECIFRNIRVLRRGWYAPCTIFCQFSYRRWPVPNAIEMLREDHRKVKQLFDEFEHAEESQAKEQIVENTVRELEVHAALEEEIFYPAAEEQVDEKESIDEAREEHHVVKLLIGELKRMSAEDERYDVKYKVL